MKMRSLMVVVPVVVLCTGCLATRSVRDFSAEGRGNEMAATAKYRGRSVKITGLVASTGFKKTTVTQTEGMGTGIYSEKNGPVGSATAVSTTRVREFIPYVLIRDAGGNSDEALCVFPPEKMEDVVKLKEGEIITVQGKFQEFVLSESRIQTVVKDCLLR